MSLLNKPRPRTEPPEAKIAITPGPNLAENLQKQLAAVEKNDLETVPRETVLKMLIQKKLDEHFIFKTSLGEGEHYIQAMRQVLSRTRKKALRKKQRLDEFKVYVISIEEKEDHDVVTLVRSKNMTRTEESVYDALMEQFKK
jgi:hypothetical protein